MSLIENNKTLKYKIIFLIPLLLSVANWTVAQSGNWPSTAEKKQVYTSLLDSAQIYLKVDANKSIFYVENALQLINSKRQRDQSAMAKSYLLLGDIYFHWKIYDLAINNYNKTLKANASLYNDAQKTKIRLKLAKSYFYSQEYKKSKSIVLELLKGASSPAIRIELWELLGDNWMGLSALNEANQAYQKALTIATKNELKDKAIGLNSKIASTYFSQGDFSNAEKNYFNSIQIAQEQSPQQEVIQNEKLADLYRGNNEFGKEIKIRKNSLQQLKKLPPKEISSLSPQSINFEIANAYVGQKRYKEAIPYLNTSIQDAQKLQDLETQKDAVQRLSEVYKKVGEYDKALANYQQYVTLVDSLYAKKEKEIEAASNFSKTLALKQNRIEILEKNRELSDNRLQLVAQKQALAKAQNRKQKLLIYFLIGGLLLLSLVLYLMYRSNQQKKLANNLLALKSLRSQMNPHFIFNALNSVNSFIAQNDERTANKYLTDFSTLMRAVLENSEKNLIPLSNEVELIQLYLKLEHARFQEKFDYAFEISPNISINDYSIPPMLIQPYIENAVWHGLRHKKEKGQLTVSIQQKAAKSLIITITDNGIGRTKSQIIKTKNQLKKESKGMGNVASRIAILNEMYSGKINIEVKDLHEDGTGTVVEVVVVS